MKSLSPLLKRCSAAYRAMTQRQRTVSRPIEKLLPRLEKVRRLGAVISISGAPAVLLTQIARRA